MKTHEQIAQDALLGINSGYYRTFKWTAIATGTKSEASKMKNPPVNSHFRATHVMARAVLNADVANVGPAGAPLTRFSDPAPTAAAPNAMPSEYKVRVRLLVGQKFLTNDEIPLPQFGGTAEQPLVLSRPIIFPAKAEIEMQLTNESGRTVDANVTFLGEEVENLAS